MATFWRFVLFLVFLGQCYSHVEFGVQNCRSNRRINNNLLHVHSASVTPHPIVYPGRFYVNVNVEVLRPFTGGLAMDVIIIKRTWLGDFTIPCISDVGSCTYDDFCGLLASGFVRNNVTTCPQPMREDNFPCACPFSRGTYPLTQAWFRLGQMRGIWGWIAAGDYYVEARLRETGTNTVRGCLGMTLSLEQRGCSNWFDCLFSR